MHKQDIFQNVRTQNIIYSNYLGGKEEGFWSKRIIGGNWRVLSRKSALFCKDYSDFCIKMDQIGMKGKQETILLSLK